MTRTEYIRRCVMGAGIVALALCAAGATCITTLCRVAWRGLLIGAIVIGCLLAGMAAMGAEVTIAWLPPTPSNNVAGYTIYWGLASRQYIAQQDVPGAHTLIGTVRDLDSTRTWFFALTAYNAWTNHSVYSTELVWDNTAPVISGPPSVTLALLAGAPLVAPDWRSLFHVADDFSDGLTLTQTPAPGESLDGVAQVVFAAVDEAGNAAELRRDVTVTITITEPVTGVSGVDDRGRKLQVNEEAE